MRIVTERSFESFNVLKFSEIKYVSIPVINYQIKINHQFTTTYNRKKNANQRQ